MAASDDRIAGEIVGEIVSSVVPGGGPVARRLWDGVAAEWRRNSSTALRSAERASGLSREDLAEWIAAVPRAVPLYLKILWAAGTNGHDKTLAAMGAVLGHAARATRRGGTDGFDDAELALRAMAELTDRHFRVLATIANNEVLKSADGQENFAQYRPGYVATQTGLREEVAHQCLINLAGAGLAVQLPLFGGGTGYPITDLGRAIVEAAGEVSSD